MLLLLFEVNGSRYALNATDVVEVLPVISIKPLADLPAGVAGVINLRGTPVPVVDLAALSAGRPALTRLSTRIVVVRDESGPRPRLAALLVERATDMRRRLESDFTPPPVRHDRAPFLGAVCSDADGLLQLIDVRGLMTAILPPSSQFQKTEAGRYAAV